MSYNNKFKSIVVEIELVEFKIPELKTIELNMSESCIFKLFALTIVNNIMLSSGERSSYK